MGAPKSQQALAKAVFLDRDGTLNEERSYIGDPKDLVLLEGVGPALRRLQRAGFKLIVVTNQSGIGRGYYTEADMHRVNEKLCAELAGFGVAIDRIYFAPEAPDQPSRGRKPSPAFLLDAQREFGLDLADSVMIGDKWIDLDCGWNARVGRCILVRTGYGRKTEAERRGELRDALVVDDLAAAVDAILPAASPCKGVSS